MTMDMGTVISALLILFAFCFSVYYSIIILMSKRNPKFLKYLNFLYHCPNCTDCELEIAVITQNKSFISEYSGIEHITKKKYNVIRCKECGHIFEENI